MRKETRDKIVNQAIKEMSFARSHKRGKIRNWQKNEDIYYGKKAQSDGTRANVDIAVAKTQEYVSTFMSKIDAPLIFKFTKRKDAQKKRAERLNALRTYDAQRDLWDIKDLVGKIQMLIYGRAIYGYSADSINGYTPNLENIDVYDFLIDPAAGGIDIEKAAYMGRYGVVKYKEDLKEGVRQGLYLKTEVFNFLEGNGNAGELTEEEVNKRNRAYGSQKSPESNKELGHNDKFLFWEWYTTYEGKRYYLLLNEHGKCAIRVVELSELFESTLWPFWSYAAVLDLTEFWTPSFIDFVREIFMAQAASINQALDNSEAINKPMKYVDVTALENLSDLKYRRDGVVRFKNGADVSKAIRFQETPAIRTPLDVYATLDALQEKASGVTASAKGNAEEDKVGIYEGNEANTADRFGLVNKSYAFGYDRFAKLYEHGVREHLTKKVAIDILGPEGIEVEEVSRRDIFRAGESFGVLIESSNAEMNLSAQDKRAKMAFLTANKLNPVINPKKAIEIEARIAGFEDEELKQLMDVSEFGDADLMSEAERDIEAILDGEQLQPNRRATSAYMQRFVDFMADHEEDMLDNPEGLQRMMAYIESLTPVIIMNTARKAEQASVQQPMTPGASPAANQPTDVTIPEPQL
jgi:hypothetical protein